MKKTAPTLTAVSLFLIFTSASWCQSGFTQQDRALLIELKTRVNEIDKRIADLREDMNKRFEQVDKRFDQVDKLFEQFMSFIWILAAIFGGMTAAIIGFALWDRRTMIRPFESRVTELDGRITANSGNYTNLVSFLKEYASKNKKFADTLQQFNLF